MIEYLLEPTYAYAYTFSVMLAYIGIMMAEGKLTTDWVLSGSTAAAAKGISPYKTKNGQLNEHIQAKHGKDISIPTNFAMELGNWFEEHIIKFACERIGLTDLVLEFGKGFKHPFYPVECSLDGTAVANDLTFTPDHSKGIYIPDREEITLDGMGVIECKLTKDYPRGEEPEEWRGWLQLKTQVECVEAKWGILLVFHHITNELRYYFYERDPAFAAELRELAEDWQHRVQTETYFDPENSNDAWLMYQEPIAEEIAVLDQKYLNVIAQIENLDENIRLSTKARDELMTTLMMEMGNHEKAICGDVVLDWGCINYKAQPEKVVPAKEAYSVRKKTIRFKQGG